MEYRYITIINLFKLINIFEEIYLMIKKQK